MLDRFGFRQGSKKSLAAEMYAQPGGASTSDVARELGGPQLNLLHEIGAQGHTVRRLSRPTGRGGKSESVYVIIFNEMITGRFDFYEPSLEDMVNRNFHEMKYNDLVSIYLIPFYMKTIIPTGCKAYRPKYGMETGPGLVEFEVAIWDLQKDPETHKGVPYFPFGLLPARE